MPPHQLCACSHACLAEVSESLRHKHRSYSDMSARCNSWSSAYLATAQHANRGTLGSPFRRHVRTETHFCADDCTDCGLSGSAARSCSGCDSCCTPSAVAPPSASGGVATLAPAGVTIRAHEWPGDGCSAAGSELFRATSTASATSVKKGMNTLRMQRPRWSWTGRCCGARCSSVSEKLPPPSIGLSRPER
eukprot:scaffold6371_cov70-Phaeocystis_antarctica.AAC.3